jgi:hypothetical protein
LDIISKIEKKIHYHIYLLIKQKDYKMTKHPEGDFSFFNDILNRNAYKDAYDAITATDSWALMREHRGAGGFMFPTDPDRLNIVHDKMKLLDSHSGASYAIMMRCMQFIATHGWDKYIDSVITSKA